MWTPKRVVLLVAGFVVFFLGYLAYAHFLGGIDGLPPLPVTLRPRDRGAAPIVPPPPPQITTADKMLQDAFGPNAAELRRLYRLGSTARGVALAFDKFNFENDGRIRLQPVSLALFGKPAAGRPHPEINTLRSDVAYLTLDRPISGINDISSRKIMAGELSGEIRIVHNRRTAQQDDDIVILVRKGTVVFDDARHLITTSDDVRLEDMQSKPKPMLVTATGLDVHLAGSPTAPKAPPRPKNDTKGEKDVAVERIVLRSNVDMHLYLAPGSGFPGVGREEAKPPAQPVKPSPVGAPPPPNDHIRINTAGTFRYDLTTDRARFDIPENPSRRFPERVVVTRSPDDDGKKEDGGHKDTLDCEHLELQFRRKVVDRSKPTKPDAPAAAPIEIEWVRATGKEVVIASEAEFLDAHGTELYYEARTRRTILKGDPEMWLLKKGNEVHARELEMINVPGAQQITARGPGRVHLLDEGGKRYHARWKESFRSAKDGNLDLLTLQGGAAFAEDEKNLDPREVMDDDRLLRCKTLLRADTLQVWLEPRQPADKAKPAAPEKPGGTGTGTKPRRVEAKGHVLARTPEMNVHDTGQLVLLFREAAVALPPAPAVGKPATPAPGGPPLPGTPPTAGPPAPEPTRATPRPIDLSARYVQAHVVRSGAKNDLERLHTEGAVHVVQAPAGPDDKGIDIRGAELDLEREAGGNFLKVSGGGDDLAELRLDKVYILGPRIHIRQAINRAWVNGKGLMQMESKTDFQGNTLSRPSTLEVLWDETMDFHGGFVEFHGGVQASQGASRLRCENLQVYFDRDISLREGNKGQPSPHARKITADNKVWVEERTLATNGRDLAGFQRLDCLELNVLTEDNQVWAQGPGWVRTVQPGGGDLDLSPRPAAPPKPTPTGEWRLTLVNYATRMVADNKKRTATFTGDVKVLYVGWDLKRANDPIDVNQVVDELPRGGIWMEADRLTVYAGQGKGAKDKTLDAFGKVRLKAVDEKSQVFWGSAEEVHYDEEKDQVILDGKDGVARLSVIERKGAPPKRIEGKKIFYQRKTGTFDGQGLTELTGATGGR